MTLHTFFGDIHNHNAMGYGLGSMARSIDIARSHLDFFAFTGHSSWHDMVPMEGGRERHWLDGFKRLEEGWPDVQRLIEDANTDNEFSAFLGFEWHSSRFGDQCVVFPDDHQPICFAQDVAELRRFCVEKSALMIPHHLAYPTGLRGVNWEVFDEVCTPVVEIFSEHGNSEHDRGPYPFFNHSMGGRVTANTARAALAEGKRFGFVASSDNHRGFPGAYGEGIMAALCPELSRQAIFEAINARRTYALTGDRIEVDFTVDGAVMGSTIRTGGEAEVAFDVKGRDELDSVEIVQDGTIVHRAFAADAVAASRAVSEPLQLRLEWGWGPWGDLALDRICDWAFAISLAGGRLLRWFPCLQSGPFDEDRRHVIVPDGENGLKLRSHTARQGGYRGNPNQSIVLEIDAASDLAVTIKMTAPAISSQTAHLADLIAGSVDHATGPFPAEMYQWHRLVPHAASSVSGKCRIGVGDRRSYVYLRAKQRNGHMAWTSPVFLNWD
jgi:hypothetical protein